MRLNISGITIQLSGDLDGLAESVGEFQTRSCDEPAVLVHMAHKEEIRRVSGEVLANSELEWVHSASKDFPHSVFSRDPSTQRISAGLRAAANWDYAEVSWLTGNTGALETVNDLLLEIIFRNRILYHEGLVIHASALAIEDKGILFTAPSGTGKSTQGALWEKFRQGMVINDDHPAVRLERGQAFIHGTPWAGEARKFLNTSAPLSAVIVVEQADQNQVIRLDTMGALHHFLPRCFLPYYDKRAMDKAIGTFTQIISHTPVYLLRCTPDYEAVAVVAEKLGI